MPKTATLHMRIEPEIKAQVDDIMSELGISTSEAVNLFFRQVIRYRGIPLDLRIPNAETIAAIEEAQRGENLHRCENLEQLFEELNAE